MHIVHKVAISMSQSFRTHDKREGFMTSEVQELPMFSIQMLNLQTVLNFNNATSESCLEGGERDEGPGKSESKITKFTFE